MGFAAFMATALGRGVRVVVGVVLIILGIYLGGILGWILGIVGLVPLFAGLANVCLVAPLIGAPFRGRDVAR